MHRLFLLGILSLSAAFLVTVVRTPVAIAQDDDDLFKDLGFDDGTEEESPKDKEPEPEPEPEAEPEPEPEPEPDPEPEPEPVKDKPKETEADSDSDEDLDSELEELEGGPATEAKKEEPKKKKPKIHDASKLDRVKAVQRKPVLKQLRVELTPFASVSLNDAFYTHFTVGGNVMFYPHDSFGLGLSGTFFLGHPKTDNHKVVRIGQNGVAAVYSLAEIAASFDVQWSPIYGKIALVNKVIVPFDLYLTAGVGFVMAGGNLRPSFNGGIGQRLMLNDWFALRFEIRDIVYNDTQLVETQERSDLQNYVLFTIGVSFFIPPSFEYAGL